MIELNVTLGIQLINFMIALIVVNYFLIRPIREIIQKRKATEAELAKGVESLLARAAHDVSAYETLLRSAREEGAAWCKQAREDALARQQALTGAAGREAAEFVQSERRNVQDEAAKARAVLSGQVAPLSEAVLHKLLA